MNPPLLLNPGILHGRWPRCLHFMKRVPDGALLSIALIPTFIWFFKRLNDGGDEPLGLLALALASLIAWRDRHTMKSGGITGALMMLSSVLLTGILPPLLRAALSVCGAGILLGMWKRPGLLGLLALSLPVVSSLQFYAGYPMRLAAAGCAVEMLRFVGIFATGNGVGMVIGGIDIAVDPACSGVRMLWHALFAAMALAAIHRASWRATLGSAALAVLLVIPANALRAAWLALEESGRVRQSGLGHDGVGLLCFLIVLLPLWFIAQRQPAMVDDIETSGGENTLKRPLICIAAMLVPVAMARPQPQLHGNKPQATPAIFTHDGVTLPLHPLPPSPEESAFSESFPGSLTSHRWGSSQVILRTVTTATRRLHPSRDCLRAAGYTTSEAVTERLTDGTSWSSFHATRDGLHLKVRERVVSEQDGTSWTDVTAWFWSALWHPLNGPWRAETILSS